jgi:O-Antigen ligase
MRELSGAPAAASPITRMAELVATYGLAAVILTLPLEFTTAFLHQQLSRYVLLAVGIAFGYLVVVRRRTLSVPLFLSAAILVAYVAASLASWAATRAPGSAKDLADVALYPFVGLLIANLPLSAQDHRRAWIAFLVSALGVSLLGFALYVAHMQIWSPNPAVANRLNITFADPNITARFLSLGACAAVLVFSARRTPPWLALATAVACGVVLPMTWSRSGLVLFVVSIAIGVVFAFDRRRAAGIGAVALIAFTASTFGNPDTRVRAEAAAGTAVTFVSGGSYGPPTQTIPGHSGVALDDNRVYLIAAGLKMFTDHPLFGLGFGGYQHALLTGYRRFLPRGYTDSVSHTALVTVLSEQGAIGIILLLLFLLQFAREALTVRFRAGPWSFWSTVAASLVIPIFLYSQFEARFVQEPYLWLALGLYYSSRMLARRQARAGAELDRPPAPAAAAA